MMLCPVCKTVDLLMTERQGVEIDYCPQCRGVWLDRGELDKIIERSAEMFDDDDDRFNKPRQQPIMPDYSHGSPPYKHKDNDHHHDEYYHKMKKRKLFLKKMFDIID